MELIPDQDVSSWWDSDSYTVFKNVKWAFLHTTVQLFDLPSAQGW